MEGKMWRRHVRICFRCLLTFLQWTIFRQASLQAPFWTTYSICRITFISTSATTMSAHLTGFEIHLNSMRANRFNWSRTSTIGRIVVWQDTALAVQQTATVVFLASMFPGVLAAVRQSHQCPSTIFYTTYLCETAFSAVTAMKTKYRSRLDIEHEIRMFITHTTMIG